ncbi:DUF3429 domain-containing protein [Vibrio caribbeanicus]|uniref:DUF3429 domain-containing protein n=1 Tax=Vibrio caribbeanicus TaxID=701175 RepID=UPI002284DA8C|nr:DUF3429 domain-containing protein [Vibrio caribbeanicus]
MKTKQNTMYSLGYLGLIPFIVGVVSYATQINIKEIGGDHLFVSYSIIIFTFLAGVLWGNGIYQASGTGARLALIMSNVFALTSWAMLFIISDHNILIVTGLAIGYLTIWFIERSNRHRFANKLDEYDMMRFRLTVGVVFLHLVMLLFLLQRA